MTLADDLDLIAEHIGDDQPNLPEGAKNTLLLAAKALREYEDLMEALAEYTNHHEIQCTDNPMYDCGHCEGCRINRTIKEVADNERA